MGSGQYILGKDGKTPVLCEDTRKWGKWFEKNEGRVVSKTIIKNTTISTVFLGLDHNYGGGIPILFETMIFGGEHDEYQERCATWEEALKMHDRALGLVRESIKRKR